QYFITQRQDVSVSFVEPISSEAEYALQQLPGVLRSETYRAVPTRIHGGHRSRRVVILGLPQQRELNRLIDAEENQAKLPPTGLLLNDALADVLGVGVGDRVRVEVLEGERPTWEVPVTGIIAEVSGTTAYMSREALAGLLGEQGSISGAHLRVDALQMKTLYGQLKETPRVAAVTIKDAALEGFRET